MKSADGLELSDHRKSVKRTSQGHKHVLADCTPVGKGKHCWRGKVTDNKHWIFFGVANNEHPQDGGFSQSYGCSGTSGQFYNNSNVAVTNNGASNAHLHAAEFVDIFLDVDKGTLRICEVGNCNKGNEVRMTGLPKHDYVPSFNIHGANISIRLAKIPTSWYSKKKSIKY